MRHNPPSGIMRTFMQGGCKKAFRGLEGPEWRHDDAVQRRHVSGLVAPVPDVGAGRCDEPV
jgi:hypothetical protein